MDADMDPDSVNVGMGADEVESVDVDAFVEA